MKVRGTTPGNSKWSYCTAHDREGVGNVAGGFALELLITLGRISLDRHVDRIGVDMSDRHIGRVLVTPKKRRTRE